MEESFITKSVVHAPELGGTLAWLNVDAPLSLAQLRGHVVLIDFWTYCCVNCMHVQPVIHELERRFADEPFAVIGVHSGKFSAERDPERIREAIGRYGMTHPIAVDDDMRLWSRYAIRSWPTLVVVRPDGTIAATAPGEPDLERLDAFIREELARGRAAGALAEAPLRIPFTASQAHTTLRYPGKVIALPDGRVAIADSGHHRVLLCQASGKVDAWAGSGLRGHRDGALDAAAFDDPQGMCWFEGALYVADTRNHAIRRIDERGVTTVAGTGELGALHETLSPTPATEVALRSPWDLCAVDDAIYVAMAGSHQIWRLYPGSGQIEVYAGTGVEALLDGPRAGSAWAQPSGLALHGTGHDDGELFVADSESSAIRSIVLSTGEVRTYMGQGLFDFGDADGDLVAAQLQHPLGVAVDDEGVLVADTYNGKLKRLILEDIPKVKTLLDGFNEPGAVAVSPDGKWLVADTNGHQILAIRQNVTSVFSLRNTPAPQRGVLPRAEPVPADPSRARGWFDQHLELATGEGLRPGPAAVLLRLRSPTDGHLQPGSPMVVRLEVSRRSDLIALSSSTVELTAPDTAPTEIAIPLHVGSLSEARVEAEMVATIDHVVCREGDAARCELCRLHLRIPLRLLREGGATEYAFDVMANAAG